MQKTVLIANSNYPMIKRYNVTGARQINNIVVSSIIFLGAFGFLIVGLSSYFGVNVLPFLSAEGIVFLPQGFVMCLYGSAGILLGLYQLFTILLKVGDGFNEFDLDSNTVRIFRWGFPGKTRRFCLTFSLDDVVSIGIKVREGLNPQRNLYLKLSDQREIPLTQIGEPIPIGQLEKDAAELAAFLSRPVEG